MNNIILNTDSYKVSHFQQYPPGTERVFSYIESRGHDENRLDSTVFFGLQAFVEEYLSKPITQEMIDEAADIYQLHGIGFNREGWEYILQEHNGYLPVRIQAVPEGTRVPLHNVLATIVNTDSQVPWLTSYLETAILRAIWYPTTVATVSNSIKRVLLEYWNKTSFEPVESLDFKLHDFGSRGVSSLESSALGGMAHLINFQGTDNVVALAAARKYYACDMAGFSIPAAEHSTITSWGRDGEEAAYRNMLKQFGREGTMLAVVSDSYDLDNACLNLWGGTLKTEVMELGATVVIRPDSGDPATVVSRTILNLMEKFGFEVNPKGYKTLPACIRVIQGDGINEHSIRKILEVMDWNKLSIDNIAFGMGGALLQHMNRDTFKFAMKCSAIQVNGEWRDVYKDPKTDPGKASKKGILDLIRPDGVWTTVRRAGLEGWTDYTSQLKTVFLDGIIERVSLFGAIRKRVREDLVSPVNQ